MSGSCPSVSITSTRRKGSPLGPFAVIQRAPDASGAMRLAAGEGSVAVASEEETSRGAFLSSSGVICQYQPECVTSNSGS